MRSKKKIIIIFIAVLLVILLILFTIDKYKTTINISIKPDNATITIDDKTYKNNSSVKFNPGKHKVEIKADGYITQSEELEFKPWSSLDIKLSLEEVSQKNDQPNVVVPSQKIDLNNNRSLIADGNASKEEEANTKRKTEKYAILKSLPISEPSPARRYFIYPDMKNGQLESISIRVNDFCDSDNYELFKNQAIERLKRVDDNVQNKFKINFTSNCNY